MRSKFKIKNRRPIAEMNVVPYIDVMLVLLVIFMVTAPLLTQGINVKLPHAQSKALNPNAPMPIVVSVNAQGSMFLNDSPTPNRPMNPQDLATRVQALLSIAQQENKARPVYVKGDRNAQYGMIANTMGLLQKAGAEQVGLITKQDS